MHFHFPLQCRDTELKVASGIYICSCECTSHIQFGTVLHATTHGVTSGMIISASDIFLSLAVAVASSPQIQHTF